MNFHSITQGASGTDPERDNHCLTQCKTRLLNTQEKQRLYIKELHIKEDSADCKAEGGSCLLPAGPLTANKNTSNYNFMFCNLQQVNIYLIKFF